MSVSVELESACLNTSGREGDTEKRIAGGGDRHIGAIRLRPIPVAITG